MTERIQLSGIEQQALELADDPILAAMLAEERIESEQFDLALLWQLAGFARPHWPLAVGAVGLSAVESGLMTVPAYMIGLALDRVTSGGARTTQWADRVIAGFESVALDWFGASGTSAAIVYLGALVLVAWVLRWIVAIVTTYVMQMLGQKIVHDLRTRIYEHISSMGLEYFHKNPVGRLVNRTTFDVQSISELFSDAFAQGLRDSMFIVVLMAVMFGLDPLLAGVLLASFPFLIAIAWVYRMMARPSMRTQQAVQSRMNSWLAENLSGMRENQLYRREQRRRAEYFQLTEAHQTAVTRVIQSWGLLRPGMMVVTAVGSSIVLLLGYERVVAGVITVGVLLTFLQYTARIWVPIRNITEKVNIIQTALTAAERVFDVLDTPRSMRDADEADPGLEVTRGRVRFEGVRFRYPSSTDDVLRGISFEANPGDMVALVGDTGAGKTTIVNLVSRFYDVTAGSVSVDGRDVRDYLLHNLRRGIAIVPQDVVVFAGTLRDNLTLGAPYSDERIMECLRAVHAEDLVDRFDDGLDHVLQESGRTLSVGERQLLSFARALIVNPPILVLDEATASVDSRTEARIQDALEELTAGRTTLVIAHRLSTIRDADLILVLRHGEVIERGRHLELIAQNGEYARLHRKHVESNA